MTTTVLKHPISGVGPYVLKRLRLRLQKGQIGVVKTIFGRPITLDCRDVEQKYFAADITKEPENLMVYQALAQAGLAKLFIDIGANCGHVAASVLPYFDRVLLIEPNPKLTKLLRELYSTEAKVTLKECAIVDAASVGQLQLKVPLESSGLATLGATELAKEYGAFETHHVEARTLDSVVDGFDLSNAYVKIDVEGFEPNIIAAAAELFHRQRPIVGFEALSKAAAATCADMFTDCIFYHARFDFMHSSGSLRQSLAGIFGAALAGAHFAVLKEDDLRQASAENYSQVFAVPREKSAAFEQALKSWSSKNPPWQLQNILTWSKSLSS